MKAMILAAGRGKRMGDLTLQTPKPLLKVADKALIVHHLEALARAGIEDVIINTAYYPEQIYDALGDGSRYGVKIQYSPECPGGLETGGGIYNALPLLGADPFLVINGDIFTDYSFQHLKNVTLEPGVLAHLILVENPEEKEIGDFSLNDKYVCNNCDDVSHFTFSGIGIYRPTLFDNCEPGFFKLTVPLRKAVDAGQVTGEVYRGAWDDVGTPERLQVVNQLESALKS